MIQPERGEGVHAADGRHLDDVARTLLPEIGQRRLRHPQGAEQVGLDLGPGLLLGDLLDGAEQAVAGVVDNDIETAEVVVGVPDGGVHRRLVGHVEGDGEHVVAVGVDEILDRVGVAGGGGHPVTPGQGRLGPDVAEALRRAGDEPDLRSVRHGGSSRWGVAVLYPRNARRRDLFLNFRPAA